MALMELVAGWFAYLGAMKAYLAAQSGCRIRIQEATDRPERTVTTDMDIVLYLGRMLKRNVMCSPTPPW